MVQHLCELYCTVAVYLVTGSGFIRRCIFTYLISLHTIPSSVAFRTKRGIRARRYLIPPFPYNALLKPSLASPQFVLEELLHGVHKAVQLVY